MFDQAQIEIQARFSEANNMLNYIRSIEPKNFKPLNEIQKTLRGLWLVSLYGAVERSTNLLIEAALGEIASHKPRSIDCIPPLHSILHYSKIQSVKDCGRNRIFDASIELFNSSFDDSEIENITNPLSESLQNVGGNTIIWLNSIFSAPSLNIDQNAIQRLNSLRERRNAISHGRESASEAGQHYTLSEMANLYNVADTTITNFGLNLKEYCELRAYNRSRTEAISA